MDDWLAEVVRRNRREAHRHLGRLLWDWRRSYWSLYDDPIGREEYEARVEAARAKHDLLTLAYLEEYGAFQLIQ